MGRIAAVDFGLKRIGVALSDETKLIARSLGNVLAEKQSSKSAQKLLDFLSSYEIERIIVGNPLLLSGKKGLLADEAHHFCDELKKLTDIPIQLWDERLSTKQAQRTLKEGQMSRKKRAQIVDGLSAVILLQSFLEAHCFEG